jgi:hypothetical protein
MYMKTHMLAALREEFDHWEQVLASLDEAQITATPQSGELSIKDEIAHLWAWQQRSIARMEAGLHNREPKMPSWLPGVAPESESDTDAINTRIYETYRDRAWAEVYQQWHTGFLHFLVISEQIPEPALLDSSRYGWLNGYALADVLLGAYDHHQEHLEQLLARLNQNADQNSKVPITMKPGENQSSTLPKTSAPAQRALTAAGYYRLEQLTQVSEAELLRLHGMGPKAIGILRQALQEKGLAFAEVKSSD